MTDEAMTNKAMTKKTEDMLAHYEAEPMQPGDVALLLDESVCVEVEGLADHWSANVRRNVATMLRPHCARVLIAVARPERQLLASDHVLWAEMREELLGSGVELLPIRAIAGA